MKYSLVLCLFLLPICLFAQLKFNPHIGFNAIPGDVVVDQTTFQGEVGLTVGAFVRIGADRKLFLVPGLQYYTYQQAVVDADGQNQVALGTATMKYLKIPLNAAVNLTGEGGTLKIFVQGGLTPSFAVGSVDEIFTETLPNIRQKDFLLGGNIGVGVDLLFATLWLNYEGAATKLFEAADTGTNVVTLAVGLRL